MSSQLSLTLFAHLCGRSEEEIDLAEAALLLAEIDHPGVDIQLLQAGPQVTGHGVEVHVAEPVCQQRGGGRPRGLSTGEPPETFT